MPSKTHVILTLFVFIVMVYFVFMLFKLIRENQRKEAFEAKAEDDKNSEEAKETFADQMLDKNLFIINTFEDVHDRKITKDELKMFADDFKNAKLTKKEMREKIENFNEKKEAFVQQDNLAELLDISKKLTTIVEKMQKNKTPQKKSVPPLVKGTIETFTDDDYIIPFSRDKKYMPIR